MTDQTTTVQDQPALRSLLSVISDGALATDVAGNRIYSNAALDRYVGRDAREPMHSTAPPAFLPDESRGRYVEYIQKVTGGVPEPDTLVLDFSVIRADGERIQLPVRLMPVVSRGGRLTGLLWLFYLQAKDDTGHSKDLERALAHIADELRSVGFTPAQGRHSPGLDDLSKRENEVFDLLLVGHRVSTVADELCLSKHTVRNHLKSIFKKTGVHSQAELIQLARGETMIDSSDSAIASDSSQNGPMR